MSKVLMLRGLPGSGKSTKAKEILKGGGNFYRVNRDHLREMLYFSDFRGHREDMVTELEQVVAYNLLALQRANVVVDDCNLGQKHYDLWARFAESAGATFEAIDIDTPVEECIERDSKRERRVGKSVIMRMALQYGRYSPTSIILCDLDGTLCDIRHRLHYVKGETRDWKSFFAEIPNDSIRMDVVEILREKLRDGHKLFFVSARPDTYRAQTEAWLEKHLPLDICYEALFMRSGGDKREDSIVKKQMLDTLFPDKSVIRCVIDDRPRVIRMWQENGLEVIDVGDGVDF